MVTMIRSDLEFIFQQILIAEADARHWADPVNNDPILGTLVPNSDTPWGLRRVDGSNNHLTPGQEEFGAAENPFPRYTDPYWVNEGDDVMSFGPGGTLTNNNYDVHLQNTSADPRALQPGDVVDADPRIISNLIVDQTIHNLAAVVAALKFAGLEDPEGEYQALLALKITQAEADAALIVANANLATADANLQAAVLAFNPLIPATVTALTDAATAYTAANAAQVDAAAAAADPEAYYESKLIARLEEFGVEVSEGTLVISNVAPDEGLSAPFNSWMTLFGQFFDHGLDLVEKGGYGTVYIPLQPDDPLIGGADGIIGDDPTTTTINEAADDLPANLRFMAVTRSTLGPDGQPINKVTPFVDQNQTYTSDPSHQVFLREYEMRFDAELGHDVPVSTGRFLDGAGGGLATWADIKAQAANLLGIVLDDKNIHSVPQVLVDPYGNFVAGANGYPQLVTSTGLISGGPSSTVDALDAIQTVHHFLDDIAHHAAPGTYDANPSPFVYAPVDQIADFDLLDFDRNGNSDANDVAAAVLAGVLTDANGDSVIDELDLADVNLDGVINAADLTADDRNPTTYDNELLDAHFITGDGRGNENIGLTTVHHVFHAEHNRQIDLIKATLINDAQGLLSGGATLAEAVAFLNNWLDEPVTSAAGLLAATPASLTWDGERLFQAAKFPTEMQYQHLVFEEFARKVQPLVNVFNDFDGELNSAILGEFAHTVYRFGHSMLTETVDRYDITGAAPAPYSEQIGLIEAFLNPLEYSASGIDANAAAGAIVTGMTRQRGNEIDEFVVDALRNNLVGLPLDLAAINIARGRETGVPSLNQARVEFFAGSGDSQVAPYLSWTDFANNLKNPASIINFIAAYGTHAAFAGVTTAAGKREVAELLVLGDGDDLDGVTINGTTYFDRHDFLQATGAYAGGSLGGLNNVDLWIGGLAEKKMIFGGMLGSTFNFIFETQLEALQNGDRFYYLSRLANLNLTAQLENNKFSEMIHRNTDATHLPGDVFSTPDLYIEVDQSRQFNVGLGNADPTDSGLLGAKVTRGANYVEFRGVEHTVFGGTSGNDTIIGDKGDDTLWGDDGDDRLEGGEGFDLIFGGAGDDVITDEFFDDEIRSGAGDDVVNGGPGLNLIITDTGSDFVWGGIDDEEMLLGQGNDFAEGGAGSDFIIGGEGNDWIESGTENGLLLGDNGDLVQGLPIKRSVDSAIEGHDVLIATGGNADFDAESGDDIMVGGLGTDRFFGQFGFDWATYKNDPYGVNADMMNRLFAAPAIATSPGVILDRYAQTEALSGSSHSDFVRGDDVTDLGAGGGEGVGGTGGTPGTATLDHALYDDLVPLINGLGEFLGDLEANPIDEAGDVRFSSGNILLGGGDSDIIEGRGGNDLIDGDRWLDVQIRVTPTVGDAYEVNGMTEIQAQMFTRELRASQLEIYRSIKNGGDADDVDVAQFSGLRTQYLIEGYDELLGVATDEDGDGFISITDTVIGRDGVDRVKNIERVLFNDSTIKITEHDNSIAQGLVTVSGLAPNNIAVVGRALLASVSGVTDADNIDLLINPTGAITGPVEFIWEVETVPGSGIFGAINRVVGDEFIQVTGETFTVTAAEDGLAIRVVARFKDNLGAVETVYSNVSNNVATGAPLVIDANDGTPTEGQLLTVDTTDIVDIDGFGPFSYQWQVAPVGTTDPDDPAWTDIAGATAASFAPDQAQVNQVLRVVVTFTDLLGSLERVVSEPTAGVGDAFTGNGGPNNPPFTAVPSDNGPTAFDDVLNGLGNNDTLNGAAGNDTLIGGTGADSVNGGLGDDIILHTIGDGGDTMIDGGADIDTLEVSGTAGANTLSLVINGGVLTRFDNAAVDNIQNVEVINVDLLGGLDTVTYNGTTENLTIDLDAGILPGLTSFAGVENLQGGAGNDTITGDIGANVLSGNGGDDTVIATDDDVRDSMNGNGGVDMLDYSAYATGLTVNLQAGGVVGGSGTTVATSDTLGGFESFTGGSGADSITGSTANNVLIGGIGNDTINGGTGGADLINGDDGDDDLHGGTGISNDIINGGIGNDTIRYTVAGTSGDGIDTVDGGDDTDTLILTGQNGTNDSLDVTFDGTRLTLVELGAVTNVESITANMLAGTDSLTYAVTPATVAVNVNLAAGTASGFTSITSIENVTTAGGNDVITSSTAANVISGNGGDDLIIVTVDNLADTFNGNAGNNTIDYSAYAVALNVTMQTAGTWTVGGSGAALDTISGFANFIGGSAGDTITGSTAANVLNGGGGADTVTGGMGSDTLFGGAGNDTFDYNNFSESSPSAAGSRDTISDFEVGDILDLNGIDAIAGGANNDFVFTAGSGTGAFTAAGQVRFEVVGTDTLVQANIGGANGLAADFEILLQNYTGGLTGANFIL